MLRKWSIWLLAGPALVLVGAGAYKIVTTAGGGGQVIAITAGALLLISPFVISRIESLSVSSSGLQMQLSKNVAELGAPKAARILDRTDLAWYAQSYSFIHEELDGPNYLGAKTHLQDLLVERAAAIARREKFDASEVRTLFTNAAPTMRVLALGLMAGDPSLADGPTILAAVESPLSANEQFQGLNLAIQCWSQLPASYQSAIIAAIKRHPEIMAGTSRRPLAEKILAFPAA